MQQEAVDPGRASVKVVFALFLIHFTGDFFASFVAPLLPVVADKLTLSLTQVGILAGVMRVLAFIVQPSVGYLADRFQTRWFMLAGVIICLIFIPLLGAAAGFWSALFVLAAGSLGNSMFHPSAAGMVHIHAGRRFNFSMSIFNLGGTLAFGVGPLFVTWYVSRFSLDFLPFTSLLGLAVVVWLLFNVPHPQTEGLRKLGFFGSLKDAVGDVWRAIALLWVVMVVRAFVGQSFMIFAPIYLKESGYSLVAVGAVISVYVTAGSVSGLLTGHLADKWGYKPFFFLSYALAAPCLYLMLILEGGWVYLGAGLAGFTILATLPLGVALAQELAPKSRSLVSSLMMGFAFGTGGFLTPVTGALADAFGLERVLAWVVWLPPAALLIIRKLPEPGRPGG